MWGKENDGDVRARHYAWLGAGEPAWQYDAVKPAPVTPAEMKEEQARSAARLREERLATGGDTARAQRKALVRGKRYTEWPEDIRELKRAGMPDQALVLLYELIDAAERDARRRGHGAPAPWYTEQAKPSTASSRSSTARSPSWSGTGRRTPRSLIRSPTGSRRQRRFVHGPASRFWPGAPRGSMDCACVARPRDHERLCAGVGKLGRGCGAARRAVLSPCSASA